MASVAKATEKKSRNELLRERLEILIKLNDGPKRRRLLRLKRENRMDLDPDVQWAPSENEDDLTLFLMESVVQMTSTKIADALKSLAPTIFSEIDDWTFFNDTVDRISATASSACMRNCLFEWIASTRAMSRHPNDTSTSRLFSFPSNCRGLSDVVLWLDDSCE